MPTPIQPLIDALPFVKFTDRAVGNAFKAALKGLDKDAEEGEYLPSAETDKLYESLSNEVKDALDQLAESEVEEEDKKELTDELAEEEAIEEVAVEENLEEADEDDISFEDLDKEN
jgi:Mn-containing catalase